jgi:hypothetical protein
MMSRKAQQYPSNAFPRVLIERMADATLDGLR